ncbi:MAG: hypothetical protein ACTSPD_09580 [Promethearchaeota archaeon]
MNYSEIKRILEKRSKEDLLKLLNHLVQLNPSLVSTIEFHLSNKEQDDRIDLEPIKKKITSLDTDYWLFYNIMAIEKKKKQVLD